MKKNYAKHRITISIFFLLIIITGVTFCVYKKSYSTQPQKEYSLGKTPHSYGFTMTKDILLYKDNVVINGNISYSGLYKKELGEDASKAGILLSDSYYGCANLYKNQAIFIDTDKNIVKTDFQGKGKEILVRNNGCSIQDALIVEDVLYYIQEKENERYTLYAMDLLNQKTKNIAERINPHYLYHYCGNVGVLDQEQKKFMICDKDKILEEYNAPEYEIQGFLNDGTIIYNKEGKLYKKQSFKDSNGEILCNKENIYRTLLKSKEMMICTLDEYGLLQVFIYDFSQGNINKIANPNTVPRDFNDDYIVCASEEEGMGNVELIRREQGDIFSIVSMNKTAENSSKNKKKNYKESISKKDKEKIEKVLKKYYKEKLHFPIISYHVADNDFSAYKNRTEYKEGNILIYLVSTEHEGKNSSVYRHIIIARENEQIEWKVIGEGY